MEMTKPTVEPIQGDEPTDLVITDLGVGEGQEAVPGTDVTVHYVGVAHSTGEQFDASWDRAQPLQFRLGGGQVIQGWDKGVAGMKVGGRRRLEIPPHLAYGRNGKGGIKPNETLIFIVDLLGVN
ncbi:FKBP-type peptidyl-prolyl cis-trans isomerase [Streptomyces hydrogenans]|uniref:FKBP-type peptidyl-prolyl cis-trans isomerase n=1 Tax=Streptomyces hydrogenans TaxID=1873719 RepID=UPI00278C3805|nr:FKBP-type peptidyl-prolyl cis-trans isomerase [Streptomyces hydrogenans]